MSPLQAATVRVPCSTSNLGAGFDTLGLALDRYLRASFAPGGDTLEVERSGTLTVLDHEPGPDMMVQVFTRTLEENSETVAGRLSVHSQIPISRGLGSSAAALTAGYALASAVMGRPLDRHATFRFAYAHEGHGDNSAPCTFGGLQAVIPTEDGPRPLALPLSPDIGFAYAAPAAGLSTAEARDALPRQVAHEVAVAELGRIIAITRGLAMADRDLIRAGMADELHVPHRLPLIPGAHNAMGAGHDAGAWAVTISGAGSGLIAMCPIGLANDVAAAMQEVFAAGGDDPGCVGFALKPEFDGVTVEG